MKDKFGSISKILIITAVSLLLCLLAIHYVDTRLNGTVGDWFVENFIDYSEWHNTTEHYYYTNLNWIDLKAFIKTTSIYIAVFLVLVAIIFFFIGRTIRKKATIRETTKLIRDYILLDDPTILEVKEYKCIESYLSEIKKQQLAKERMVADEVNKKNELITYLAHDLKTPLTSVIGYLSLLDEVKDLPKEQQEKYIRITLDKANRLETLINELFDITRYNLNEVALEKESISLSLMLNQIAEEFYPMANQNRNKIHVCADDNLGIYADPDKLARVFNNILKNAIAYSHPNTEIRICAKKNDDHYLVTFTNAGKTIPEHSLNVIFEKFYRLDSARSSQTGGAGLGLAIAKEIIVQHGGDITATSREETTTFTIILPIGTLRES